MKFIVAAMFLFFAIVLVAAAPAHDETIVDDVANDDSIFVISHNDPNSFLKLLKLKKLLLLG
ncbi:CLUMA_CG001400, isoform A [Clunio marinus]|uniref:CLUMA_CG001400, isoform A n=1 Tax=Clunio marinus TaxID=568069 RepID=A0A1J1HJL5_9DIPT|nr:CLUMA_CG001400, isoform A [Clunio marinus]